MRRRRRYVTQMPGKMFADYAVPSIHAWAMVLQISEVVRPGVFRSIRQIARATCEPPCTCALVQVSFGFTVIYLLVAKSGNNVVTAAQGDGDVHKVRDGLQDWLEDEANADLLKKEATTVMRRFWLQGLNHSVFMHICLISNFDLPHLGIQLASEGYGQ